MSSSRLLALLYHRLHIKVAGVIPIISGALVLAGGLSILLYVVAPALPDAYQRMLQHVQRGEWTASRTSLTQVFDSYGPAKVYVFLGVQVLQVLVAPIPGQVLGLLGGYLFGFWYGLVLTMGGLAIGSSIVIGLGRVFGEHIARKIVPPSIFARFDYLVATGGLWNFFLLFLLPALPDDAICLIAGLTRLKVWHVVVVCVLGRLPGMAVLTFVGASADGNGGLANVVLSIAMIGALVLWLFSEEAETYFYRVSKGQFHP